MDCKISSSTSGAIERINSSGWQPKHHWIEPRSGVNNPVNDPQESIRVYNQLERDCMAQVQGTVSRVCGAVPQVLSTVSQVYCNVPDLL